MESQLLERHLKKQPVTHGNARLTVTVSSVNGQDGVNAQLVVMVNKHGLEKSSHRAVDVAGGAPTTTVRLQLFVRFGHATASRTSWDSAERNAALDSRLLRTANLIPGQRGQNVQYPAEVVSTAAFETFYNQRSGVANLAPITSKR